MSLVFNGTSFSINMSKQSDCVLGEFDKNFDVVVVVYFGFYNCYYKPFCLIFDQKFSMDSSLETSQPLNSKLKNVKSFS